MTPGDPHNSEIADALEELADLYELDGAVVHRVRAYRTAAQTVRTCTTSVAALARADRATELAGIGQTIQDKIRGLLQDGVIPAAARLRRQYPPGLIAITRLPGIGAKRARTLHDELGIDSPQALREAAAAERVRTVKGLGPKFEQRALAALAADADAQPRSRVLAPTALQLAETILAGLAAEAPPGTRVEIAGSLRRATETVKDIDLVAVTDEPQALADRLARVPEIESVASAGPAAARAATHAGLSIDLRIGTPGTYGNLLQHFTGSAAHNAALREMAVKAGLHVSEHGVEEEATGEIHACREERDLYERLAMAWIEPELREDRGELQAAALREGGSRSTLPKLIVGEDIEGELHCHTTASDGTASIEEMAEAAAALGYSYLAITDHSASHGFGNAVPADALRRQIERIRELREENLAAVAVLAGSEVNILPDGSLDYPDELLSELDWVIASVHTAFGMGEADMTRRIIAAAEHPLVDAIGHPTGRLLLRREPYALDVEALIEAAARTGTMLEINANPDRRDLSEIHARTAARAGARLLISSDAHRPEGLANMRWGVATARRGWLESDDVANTRTWRELRRMRKRER